MDMHHVAACGTRTFLARVQEGMDDLRRACFASRMVAPAALYHSAGLLHRNRLAPSLDSVADAQRTNGDPDAARSPPPATGGPEEDRRLFPAAHCQLSLCQLREFRSALARTLDALIVRLAPCLHEGASDRAADTLATAFVAQRLPPSWLPERPEDLDGEEPDAEEMAEVAAMRYAPAPALDRFIASHLTVDPTRLPAIDRTRFARAPAAPFRHVIVCQSDSCSLVGLSSEFRGWRGRVARSAFLCASDCHTYSRVTPAMQDGGTNAGAARG